MYIREKEAKRLPELKVAKQKEKKRKRKPSTEQLEVGGENDDSFTHSLIH